MIILFCNPDVSTWVFCNAISGTSNKGRISYDNGIKLKIKIIIFQFYVVFNDNKKHIIHMFEI